MYFGCEVFLLFARERNIYIPETSTCEVWDTQMHVWDEQMEIKWLQWVSGKTTGWLPHCLVGSCSSHFPLQTPQLMLLERNGTKILHTANIPLRISGTLTTAVKTWEMSTGIDLVALHLAHRVKAFIARVLSLQFYCFFSLKMWSRRVKVKIHLLTKLSDIFNTLI